MAKQVITQTTYIDDIDGTPAAGTIVFSWDGTQYEIDLSKSNTRAFEKAVKPFVDNARKVRASRTKATRSTAGKRDLSAVREWAHANGFAVSQRGRVAQDVLDAYDAAN